MKLKSVLKELSHETLLGIHAFWRFNEPRPGEEDADPAARKDALIEFLYPRLQLRHSFLNAFSRLDADEKDLIHFLAIHGGDIEAGEAAARCAGGSAEALRSRVASLGAKGFVFFDRVEFEEASAEMIGLPEPYLRFIELPSYWEGYLGSFLKNLSAPELRAIANRGLRLGLKTSVKRLLIWRIRKALTAPAFLKGHVNALPAEQRDILEALLERRGVSVYRELLDQNYLRRYDQARVDHIHALSTTSGLVFTAVSGENKQNSLLMVPRDISYIVRSGYQPDDRGLRQLDTVSVSTDEARRLTLDNSTHILRDLTLFVAAVRLRQPRVLANGSIGRNDLKKILPCLSAHKTLKYVKFLALYCIRRRFLCPGGEVWTVSDSFTRWAAEASAAYEDLYNFWLDDTAWNEEFPEGDVLHAEPAPANLVHVPELRRLVLRNLESLPNQDWGHFDAFAESLLPQVAAAMPERGNPVEAHPLRHDLLVLESIVAEGLHWLGLISLGIENPAKLEEIGSRGDETLDPLRRQGMAASGRAPNDYAFTFKPTELGRHVFSGSSADPSRLFNGRGIVRAQLAMDADQFAAQPNLEILAPPDLRLPMLFMLAQIADVLSVDVMSAFALTRRSLRAAMDQGMDAAAIESFLESGSSIPLPDTVRQMIQECANRHGEVDMGVAGGYIAVDDPALLEEIRTDRRIRDYVKDVIAQRIILLAPNADVPKLARDLRKSGFMPRVDSENVLASSDGSFYIRLRPEDLYDLLGVLKFVVAMEEDLGQSVTEEKTRPLLERLQPDPSSRILASDYADAVSRSFMRRLRAARKRHVDEVAGKYKQQLARLLTTGATVERRPAFEGVNPALEAPDVRRLIEFAIETDTRIEIAYRHAKNGPLRDTIEPETLTADKVYAYSEEREDRAVFLLSRIRKARLL